MDLPFHPPNRPARCKGTTCCPPFAAAARGVLAVLAVLAAAAPPHGLATGRNGGADRVRQPWDALKHVTAPSSCSPLKQQEHHSALLRGWWALRVGSVRVSPPLLVSLLHPAELRRLGDRWRPQRINRTAKTKKKKIDTWRDDCFRDLIS